MNIISILQNSTVKENTLKLNTELERSDYLKVAEVIERLGGKWNSRKKYHEFP